MPLELPGTHHRASGLVDVLDRVLDKGLVVAGDIKVSLAEVELLTIRIRLLVCSLDKAQEIGLDWWRYDRDLSSGGARAALAEQQDLRAEIRRLQERVDALASARGGGRGTQQTRVSGGTASRRRR
jgi:Gas vesicle protein